MKRIIWNFRAWLYDRLVGAAIRVMPYDYYPSSPIERMLRREQSRFEEK